MPLPYVLQKNLQTMELLVCNEYIHLHTNSTSKKYIILIMFSFNKDFF